MKKLILSIYLFIHIQRHRILTFFIPFAITWFMFQVPTIYGLTMYVLTQQLKYLTLAISWVVFTAPPLPIPVMPLSVASGLLFERLLRKKKRV